MFTISSVVYRNYLKYNMFPALYSRFTHIASTYRHVITNNIEKLVNLTCALGKFLLSFVATLLLRINLKYAKLYLENATLQKHTNQDIEHNSSFS